MHLCRLIRYSEYVTTRVFKACFTKGMPIAFSDGWTLSSLDLSWCVTQQALRQLQWLVRGGGNARCPCVCA